MDAEKNNGNVMGKKIRCYKPCSYGENAYALKLGRITRKMRSKPSQEGTVEGECEGERHCVQQVSSLTACGSSVKWSDPGEMNGSEMVLCCSPQSLAKIFTGRSGQMGTQEATAQCGAQPCEPARGLAPAWTGWWIQRNLSWLV